jgi:phosphoadenosine phosphosulfate reductase
VRGPGHRPAPSRLYWCDSCNVPLIGSSCGKCGRLGRRVGLTSLGEVRLPLEGTRRRLRYIFLRDFGVQQLIPDMFVLNKSSGEDRAEEIIVDGWRIALLTYDLERCDYRLTLRIDGARMLAGMDSRKQIFLRKAAGHLKDRHLPTEIVDRVDPGIRAGDEVIIRMGKFIGCGSAKVDAGEIRTNPKGVRVRDISQAGPLMLGRRAWPKDLIRANRERLIANKSKAEREIASAMGQHRLPLTASFSGGKDSLVVLDLLSSVARDFAVIFIDTGLEHPWTREYVDRYARKSGLRLIRASAEDAFDDSFPTFGPPAKDFRWCCKVCKLAPVAKLIEERFPHGTLTVEGNRRLESFARSQLSMIEENPFVPGQVIVNPIRDWTALEVWLHILWRGLEFNRLYEEDIERVGCWMCPSALASECAELERLSPELAKTWHARLTEWAQEHGLPREYVSHGFWRWKEPPPKMRDLAKRLGVEVRPKRADTLELRVLKGVSPCAAGGYSVDAVLSMPEAVGLDRVAELLKTVGEVELVQDFGVAIVRAGHANAKAFAGGQLTAVGETPEAASELFDLVARAVLRANMCTKCGICTKVCERGAIVLDGAVTVDEKKCTRCGKCAESCVVAHYFDKLAAQTRYGSRQSKGKGDRVRRAPSTPGGPSRRRGSSS